MKKKTDLLSIGQVAARTGLAVSAIRFYEEVGLVASQRNAAGHRRFARSNIRRLSFVLFAQRLGYRLDAIKAQLDTLPPASAPTDDDWKRFSVGFSQELDSRIAELELLREKLSGCIGCGCLSLERCAIYNRDDAAEDLGPGPRWLLGDEPAEPDMG